MLILDRIGLQLKQAVLGLMGTSAVADVEATFDNISKLYDAHRQFVTDLNKTASDWSPQTSVGEHLKVLVSVGCIFEVTVISLMMLCESVQRVI